MRISKPPEERRREMIETAMKVFSMKGYEAATISDIAREMKVVPGLCYRYFSSKEEIYQAALAAYARECAAPMVEILSRDYASLEDCVEAAAEGFRRMAGKERYRAFFHHEGNAMFHRQLDMAMLDILLAPMDNFLKRMGEKGLIHIGEPRYTALFLLHGQMPILNDDTLSMEDKIRVSAGFIKKLLL